MNAPLSRYLTQFSAPPAMRSVEMPTPFEPKISLTAAELDRRIETALAAAGADSESRFKAEIAALQADHEAALAQALADARAEWVGSQSDILIARMDEAMAVLRESIVDGLVRALRPVLSKCLIERASRELKETLEKLFSDSDSPVVAVRGPSDLIAPLRQHFENAAIEWAEADLCEVTITADATRIDTCIGAALTELAEPEA